MGLLLDFKSNLDLFFAVSPNLMFILGTDLLIKEASPAAERTFGRTVDELRARPIVELVHPEDRAATEDHLHRPGPGNPKVTFDNRCRRADGAFQSLAWTVALAEGLLYASARDIAAGMPSNESPWSSGDSLAQLAKADHGRLEALAVLDATDEALMWIATDSRVLGMTRPFCDMFQVRPDELVGSGGAGIAAFGDRCFSDSESIIASFDTWLADPRGQFTHDIDQMWPVERKLEVSCKPAPGAGRLLTFRDVSRERAAGRLQTDFVSMIAHELRTSVTTIKGFLELVLGGEAGEINESQREYLDIARIGADGLAKLVSDLLSISRIESGKVKLESQPVDIVDLVRGSAETWRPIIERKGQELLILGDEPRLMVDGDPDRLGQVVNNLLSNAHHYTPTGGRLTCWSGRIDGMVCLEVGDNGVGLTTDEQAHVFDKFYRSNNRATREVHGNGLGLSVVKSQLWLHGGTVQVRSEVSKGSVFRVTLPPLDE